MRTLILTLALAFGLSTANAQTTGDWYVGTGDIANTAWTEWSVSPTIGYGVMDNLMVGCSVSQTDSTADLNVDFHARYFWKGYFGYLATDGLSTDGMSLGLGKLFTLRNNIYVDPKVVYNTGEKTTNLTLGFGFKF
mgnify:FL=1|tara:strand:- start:1277 stop:1684 length:408 start_codon:yes stop_codon:yes gene_type:complete